MRVFALVAVAVFACCSGARQNLGSAEPALDPKAMMETTVQVHVSVEATMFTSTAGSLPISRASEKKIKTGKTGSGVVYAKTQGLLKRPRSRILSAHHVLEAPAVGTIEETYFQIFGMKIPTGTRRIDAVKMTITTSDGRTCNLKPLALGATTHEDVATAEADCDAGNVAKIASRVPMRGDLVYVSGHPHSISVPVLTSGWVSGWDNEYMLISAEARPGNSGGPVFHQGEVVGLLVRIIPGSQISLMTPLFEILERIRETQPLTE